MKEVIKRFEAFTYQNGLEATRVFDDLLRYIIHGFSLPGLPGLDDWKYTKEQNAGFGEIFRELILAIQEELKHREWFDAFGFMYESLIASKSRRSNSGQFFTPEIICDLMTAIGQGEEKVTGKTIGDCACGSGRTLISFHVKNPGNYYIAEDVDRTCAMMTVCNFLFHGMKGEVIWHDSLNPDSFFGAWRVNEFLGDFRSEYWQIPHIRPVPYEQTRLKMMNDNRLKVVRIQKKLKESAETLLKQLKGFGKYKSLSEEEKAKYKEIRGKYANVLKLIRKYE